MVPRLYFAEPCYHSPGLRLTTEDILVNDCAISAYPVGIHSKNNREPCSFDEIL